jgi:tetratricopeptide (TPR) repeat protein
MATSARIDELRKKFDENPRRYFAPLANEYRKTGDLEQAAFILEEYLPQQPGHMSGHIVYGQTLFELGRDEEARKVFETALTLDPENLIALRHLGHISRQAGDFEAARSWYQRLLEADPRDAEIEQLLVSVDAAAQARSGPLHPSMPEPAIPDEAAPATDETYEAADIERSEPVAWRPTTHPLAPPPLPFPAQPGHPTPASPIAQHEEGGAEEAEQDHELLDLDDFSLGTAAASHGDEADSATHESAHGEVAGLQQNDHEASSDSAADDTAQTFAGLENVSHDESEIETPELHSEIAEPAPQIDASAAHAAEEPAAADEAMGFVPFSGLQAPVVAEAENIDGLETYTFESPDEPVVEEAEDLGSFFMEPTFTTPASTESVEPVEAAERVHEEFSTPTPTEPAETDAWEQVEQPATNRAPTPVAASAVPSTPIASTPVSATPVSATRITATPIGATPVPPVSAATPVVGASPVPEPQAADAEGDAFATETMAKLYMSQGHLESALGIYRTLSTKRPEDEGLRQQVEELEDRVLRRRREPTPATPINAAEAVIAATPEGTPTIRDFLVGIIRRGGSAPTSAVSHNGGSIDALFGGASAFDDDVLAADTLAQAFATEPGADPMHGQPARPAASELSLDHVFRQPSPAHAGEGAGGFSFDQFFAGDLTEDATGAAAEAPGDTDDIAQFNAWLNGLKKS